MQDADEELLAKIRQRGLRLTPQRLIAYRTLRRLDRHVTADEVFHSMSEQLPGTTLPTVYATLDMFETIDLLRRVPTRGGAAIYDPVVQPHHHMVCSKCGRVEDLAVSVDLGLALASAAAAGFHAHGAGITVFGNCRACAGS